MRGRDIVEAFAHKRVMLVGDLMLDSYCFGKVDRISPEAPVPVVAVKKREDRLGGAANVALNLVSLGAEVLLCGVVGKDQNAEVLERLLKENNISSNYLYRSSQRPTTQKLRVIGNNTQLLRIDDEETSPLQKEEEKAFVDIACKVLQEEKIDALIIEDYDKGAIGKVLIEKLVEIANSRSIPISVDPKKRNFKYYKNVSLFKPNRKELLDGLAQMGGGGAPSIIASAEAVREQLSAKMIMVTLSEEGILIKSKEQTTIFPAIERNIADVSGAGDTVISVATLCMCIGLNEKQIAYISNLAGGIVCGYVGVVPIDKEILIKDLENSIDENKIFA